MLPFFLQETKTVEIAGLIFDAYDSLTPEEEIKISKATEVSPNKLVMQLVQMISRNENIATTKAFAVINGDDPEAQVIRDKYLVEIGAFSEQFKLLTLMQKIVGVTAIMHRAYEPMNKQLEEMKSAGGLVSNIKKYEDFVAKLKGWTDEDTKKLPPEVIQAIWAFFLREQNGGKEPEVQTTETEADTATETEEKKESTGQKSIGESSDIGQTIPDLAA